MRPIMNHKMNKKDMLMLLLSLIFLVFVILIFIQAVRYEPATEVKNISIPVIDKKAVGRQSISFIMGEDEKRKNAFYANATSYFKYHPEARTDEIVTDCRSLTSLQKRLKQYYYRNQKPYSIINIVVHSNPWSGMSLPIEEEGMRITAESLEEAYEKALLEKLDNEMIDEETRILVHACGLARNKELTEAFHKVMGGDDEIKPTLISSDGYVNFQQENDQFFKSEMEVFYAFYPTAHKPADLHLARQLSKRYPEVEMEWLTAIQNESMNTTSDAFSYKYNVPVEWEIEYPEYDAPALESELDKMEWLMNQDDLLEIINETEIPFEYFRWIVKKGNKVSEEDYIEVPYIKVYGKVTVLCVLRTQSPSRLTVNRA